MMSRFSCIIVFLLIVHIFACAGKGGFYHRVNKGETLYRIAKGYGVSQQKIIRANNMRDAGFIREGQYLFIPDATGETQSFESSSAKNNQQKTRQRGRANIESLKGRFLWPLKSSSHQKVQVGFGMHDKKRHNGVDMPAPEGTPVVAVAAGKIIYAGEQLAGYGKTVIIRHPEEIFSIYSHLGSILITENQNINQGETIGKVGSIPEKHFRLTRPHLHFEIRERTVPINPVNLLP